MNWYKYHSNFLFLFSLQVTLVILKKKFPNPIYFKSSFPRYGAMNDMSTETYETLHKYYVKNPYWKSNKKDVIKQILNKVRYYIFLISNIRYKQ